MRQLERDISRYAVKHKFATGVSLTEFGGEHAPRAVLQVQLTRASNAKEARKWIAKAVSRFDSGSDEIEFVALKQRALIDLVVGFDSLKARADRFADYLQLADGNSGYFVQELERLDKVTR